jgi:hypothetical protein
MKVLARRNLSVFRELEFISSLYWSSVQMLQLRAKSVRISKSIMNKLRNAEGTKKAIIAIAHKLLNCIYHMLDKNEPFNYDLYNMDSKPKQTYAP